jgi:type I restriction enzyme S subunit
MTKDTNIPQGYKDSPLGIIPKEWEVKRLGDCTSLLTNGFVGVATPHYTDDPNGIIYIQGFNVTEGSFNFKGIKKVTKSFHNKNIKSSLKEGDLLTIQTGDIGLTTIVPKELEGSNCHALIISRFHKIIDPRFMLYYYNSSIGRKRFHIIETGSTMKHINTGDLHKFFVPVPPIEEQIIIVGIGRLWDTAIEKQQKLIEKLKLLKRALMQLLLTGKKRLSGFTGEWKKVKLGDIAVQITRKNAEDNKNVVTISAQRGFVIQTDFFKKSVASEILDNYFLVHRNEFCYNKSYSYGYPMGAIKRLKVFDKAVVTTLYICFRLKEMASVNIDFFEQYCESGIFNKELVKIANEGGRAHGLLNVTPSDFFNMHMSIPDIDEQNAIASVFVNADKEIELANGKLANLQSQKRGLMQQLLTGKKRIKS